MSLLGQSEQVMKVLGKHISFNKVQFNSLTLLFNCIKCFEAVCFLVFNLEKLTLKIFAC